MDELQLFTVILDLLQIFYGALFSLFLFNSIRFPPELVPHLTTSHEPGIEIDSSQAAATGLPAVEQDYTPLFQRVSITGDEDTGGVS